MQFTSATILALLALGVVVADVESRSCSALIPFAVYFLEPILRIRHPNNCEIVAVHVSSLHAPSMD